MNLSDNQQKMLFKLENGVIWTDLSETELQTLWYLDKLKLATAREDIREDLWMLTEAGSAELYSLRAAEERAQKEAEDSSTEKARQEKQQRFDNKLAVLNTVVPIVTFILGILANHFLAVADLVAKFWEWFVSLF
jgi:uncharacterized membrane protein